MHTSNFKVGDIVRHKHFKEHIFLVTQEISLGHYWLLRLNGNNSYIGEFQKGDDIAMVGSYYPINHDKI